MIMNLVPPVIVTAAFIAAMTVFGVWCGLGPLQSLGIASGGVMGCFILLAIAGGIVQMILARRADKRSFEG